MLPAAASDSRLLPLDWCLLVSALSAMMRQWAAVNEKQACSSNAYYVSYNKQLRNCVSKWFKWLKIKHNGA